MDRNIIAILLNSITEDLKLSDTQAGAMSGFAFAIFYATLGIPIARLADRHNRTRIITISLTLWSAMTAVCGLAGNFWQLLIARMGVGVGEAGCVPPSQSIIADYFPQGKRAFAMGVFGLGVPLGTLMGYGLGGYINEIYDWRIALYVVGLPGILVAVVVHFTLREPPRGLSDKLHAADGPIPNFMEVLRFIRKRRSLFHMTVGASLIVFGGYGSQTWIPAFFERSHGLTSAEIGLKLGPVFILGGVGGALLGGWLADKWGSQDPRWYMRIPALAILPAVPFSAVIMLMPATTYTIAGTEVSSSLVAILMMIVPGAAYSCYLGPTNAMLQQMVSLRMRATTVAIFLLVTNLIGMGLGPLTIGIVSDVMDEWFGTESLRYTMLSFLFIYVWASFHFFRAARTISADLEAAKA